MDDHNSRSTTKLVLLKNTVVSLKERKEDHKTPLETININKHAKVPRKIRDLYLDHIFQNTYESHPKASPARALSRLLVQVSLMCLPAPALGKR